MFLPLHQEVTWSSSDYAKAGVYSADGKNATLIGRKTGTTVVTATVKNNEGNVAAKYVWNVTVTDGSAANAGEYTVTYTIDGKYHGYGKYHSYYYNRADEEQENVSRKKEETR